MTTWNDALQKVLDSRTVEHRTNDAPYPTVSDAGTFERPPNTSTKDVLKKVSQVLDRLGQDIGDATLPEGASRADVDKGRPRATG